MAAWTSPRSGVCAALLRIYFPDIAVSRAEFEHYCLGPAKAMRGMIREQMATMDPEYSRRLAPVECTL